MTNFHQIWQVAAAINAQQLCVKTMHKPHTTL